MIWIDYSIIGLIAISSAIGLMRGFVREAFSLFSWGVAIWIGYTFSRDLAVFLETMIAYPSMRIAGSFMILFFITLIIFSLIGYLLGVLVRKTGLTGSDRFIGMVFGIGRGVLVVAVLVMLGGLTPLPEDPWWKESQLIPPFQSVAMWLHSHLPSGLAGYINYR